MKKFIAINKIIDIVPGWSKEFKIDKKPDFIYIETETISPKNPKPDNYIIMLDTNKLQEIFIFLKANDVL